MPARDLDLLVDAAKSAGEIALGHWRSDLQVWEKGKDDPVSEADLAVDAHLKSALMGARPDHGWLSEETPDTEDRLQHDAVFIVDPIDGTRAFVDGKETWAISVALAEHGRPSHAVVYLPARDKLYTATAGQGAMLNGEPLSASERAEVSGATLLANKASFAADHWDRPPVDIERMFRPSLAYRLALVGDGSADGMVTFRDTWEWDIAAGVLIAAEAGARVSDRFGAGISLNTPDAKAKGIIAASPNMHSGLMSRLKPRA